MLILFFFNYPLIADQITQKQVVANFNIVILMYYSGIIGDFIDKFV